MFFIKVVLDDDKLGHTKSVQLISFLSLFCRVSTHSPLSWANLPVDPELPAGQFRGSTQADC